MANKTIAHTTHVNLSFRQGEATVVSQLATEAPQETIVANNFHVNVYVYMYSF